MGTKATPQKERLICPPNHGHAVSQYCYTSHRCRCDECKALRAKMSRQRRRNEAYGRPTTSFISADRTREHINTLREWGIGYRRVAELAGVGSNTVLRHMRGNTSRIAPDVAAKILAVRPSLDHLAPGAQIPAVGVKRRLWALRKLGWHSGDIAERLGVDRTIIAMLLVNNRTKVTVRWHLDIAAVYDELSMTVPSATPVRKRVRRLAARHPGPLDWDDIDTDPTPPRPVVNRQVTGVSERERLVRELHAQYLSDAKIAERVGVTDRTVLRIRQRLGLPAWTKEQQEAA